MQHLAVSAEDANQNSGSSTVTQTDRNYLMTLAQVNHAATSRRASMTSLYPAGLGLPAHIRTLDPVFPYNPAVASLASISQVGREEQLRMNRWDMMANNYAGSRYNSSRVPFGGMMAYQPPYPHLPLAYRDTDMYGRFPRFPAAVPFNAEGEISSASPTSAVGNPAADPGSASSLTRNTRLDFKSLWGKRYSQLKEFKQVNGHCNVPQRYAANAELGRWVKDQRTFKVKNKLSQERIDLLNKIGFAWRVKDHGDFWNKMCKDLVSFKAANGHCNVSMSNTKNLQLARWVDRNRRGRKNGKLSEERIRQLDEIGFTWSTR